jgi:hypothetical protein
VRADLPPGRYDGPSRRQRVAAITVSGLLAGAALLGGYQLYSRHNAGRLDAELTGYDVRSDDLVRISFQVVTRGHRGECKVQARDRTLAVSGSKIVPVEPSGQRAQVVTVDVPTHARAVTGELLGCRRL